MRIDANFSAPVRSGTTNTTFSFSDTSTGLPRSWLWNFGDGTTSTEQNPTHRYTSPGTYTVTLTATNAVSTDTETKSAYITVASSGGGSPVIYPTDGKAAEKIKDTVKNPVRDTVEMVQDEEKLKQAIKNQVKEKANNISVPRERCGQIINARAACTQLVDKAKDYSSSGIGIPQGANNSTQENNTFFKNAFG
jgi:PKD repeat protein